MRKKSFIRSSRQRKGRGQTFIEYTLLIGVFVVVLVAMTPMVRRVIQSMVKLVADQVGNQVNAEQHLGQSGYLVSSYSDIKADTRTRTKETSGIVEYIYNDIIYTGVQASTNLGYSQQSGN